MSDEKRVPKEPEQFTFSIPKEILLPGYDVRRDSYPDNKLISFCFEKNAITKKIAFTTTSTNFEFYKMYFESIGSPLVGSFSSNMPSFLLSDGTFEKIMSSIIVEKGICCDPKVSAYFPEDHPIQKALLTNLKKREQELDALLDKFKQHAESLNGVEIPDIPPRVSVDTPRDISTINHSLIKKSEALYLLHRNLVMGINKTIGTQEFLSEYLSSLISELKSTIGSMLSSEKDEKSSGKQVALASRDKEELEKINNWLDFGLSDLNKVKQELGGITLFAVPPKTRRCSDAIKFYGIVPYTEYGQYGPNPVPYQTTSLLIDVTVRKVLETRKRISSIAAGEGVKSSTGWRWFSRLLGGSQPKQQGLITEGRDSKHSQALVVSKPEKGGVLSGDKDLPDQAHLANFLKREKKTTNPVYELLKWKSFELHGRFRNEFSDHQIIQILEELLKDEEIVQKCFVDFCVRTNRISVWKEINIISALTNYYDSPSIELGYQLNTLQPEARIKASIMICEAFKNKKTCPWPGEGEFSIRKCVSVENVLPKLKEEAARLEAARLKAEPKKAEIEVKSSPQATSITTSQAQSAEQKAFERHQENSKSSDLRVQGEALREMGRCYETGEGVEEPDNLIALTFYKLAQEAGDKKATGLYSSLKEKIEKKPESQPAAAGGYHPGLQSEHRRREAAALKQDDNSVNKGHSSGPSSSSSQSTKK